eukprot:scaffold899_cov168-Ochromonas_danica.AAC.4
MVPAVKIPKVNDLFVKPIENDRDLSDLTKIGIPEQNKGMGRLRRSACSQFFKRLAPTRKQFRNS